MLSNRFVVPRAASSLINEGDARTWCEAVADCEDLVLTVEDGFELAEHAVGDTIVSDDWRYPNVRETYSLMFYGRLTSVLDTVDAANVTHPAQLLLTETLIHPFFGHHINGIGSSTVQEGAHAYGVSYFRVNIGNSPVTTQLDFVSNIQAVRNADP